MRPVSPNRELSTGWGFEGTARRRSSPTGWRSPSDAMLGADGAGLDIALADVLPWFLVLNAAFSVGLMEAVTDETGAHLQSTRLEHLNQSLADSPVARMDHARMRIATDQAAALLDRHAGRHWPGNGPTRCCGCWRSKRQPGKPPPRSPTWP